MQSTALAYHYLAPSRRGCAMPRKRDRFGAATTRQNPQVGWVAVDPWPRRSRGYLAAARRKMAMGARQHECAFDGLWVSICMHRSGHPNDQPRMAKAVP
jgi:hypothetical protein